VRTARVTLESNYIWGVYHADDIAREVHWQSLSERSQADIHQCLAWLYDGFRFPQEADIVDRIDTGARSRLMNLPEP
jgi:hypothetical protein